MTMPVNLVNVRGTELLASDTRDQYRQKIARITLDSMVQFVGLLDANGTVLEINQVALDAVGIKLAAVEGKPFWTTFWWQVSEEINATLRESILRAAQGEFVRWDTPIYGRAGGKETIIIDASLCPVKDEQGNVVFIAAEGRDITEKKAYEREIARQREELARLDELKTQFFANISHEFRTPLTLMLGPLEDAAADSEEPLGARQGERITMVQRNGLRLQKLVNALLDFSRVEAGRIQAVYQPSDLAALTHDLASSFRSACQKADLTLTIRAPPLPEPVFVDHEMWEKIVLNLVSNAFKFTLEGGITIAMSAEDGHAVLRVSDTGTGIPESEVAQIFDRFYRVEDARGRTHEGTGIGLALVKQLIELHKGAVTVESTVGKGTTFMVRVPFGHAHLPRDRLEASRTQASTATRAEAFVSEALRWLPGNKIAEEVHGQDEPLTTPDGLPGKRAHVLLADDNADMRDYLCRLLATGYDVTAAADGEEALAAARRARPDLILTDVMMPRLDGFGLLHELRDDPELRGVPVIVLSARAGEEAKIEGLRRGADDYLVKPFSARELRARVAANIELSRTRAQSARVLHEEAHILELLNKVGTAVAAEHDLERAVQVVTDAATELSGAAFGSFFYNVIDEKREAYTLYTLSGVSRDSFAKFPMPRNTAVFASTFNGEGIVRSDDITADRRYGKNAPHRGMPEGHLPVRSYLAAPVKSRSGEVLGGLFFGHREIGIFTERAERIVSAIAVQAGIAIDKARLYRAAQEDIAQRKHVEAALRESEQMLESKVAERTEDLLAANERLRSQATARERVEEQLRHAQKMEAIGQLTGGVAHDFNNLLTIVMGNIESIQRHLTADAPARLRRWVENAMHGARRAATLTQHLLAFSRRQPLDPKPTELNRLILNTSQMLARTLGERAEVQTVLGAGLWNVEVDPNQLETALLNLALNARDAMPEGGKLTIETANTYLDDTYIVQAAEVLAGQYVVLCVSDTGSGMTKEILDHVFEPFFTTKPTGQGTGLGLSQVYGFVKQSGGHVKIYSEKGQGTTVKIYLPRLFGKGVETGNDIQEGTVPDGHQKETVLVVEDNPGVREYSAEILRDLGYTIIEAEDGPAALRQIERNEAVDLLFTDIGLPGMNGRELAEEALRRRPKLKVLYTTAYAKNAVVHHGRLDPGVQLIPKPFTHADLATKIRTVMDSNDK